MRPAGWAQRCRYSQQSADLLITAQRLAGLGGLNLVRALRAEQAALPILLYSADARLKADALAAGASAFVEEIIIRAPYNRILCFVASHRYWPRRLGIAAPGAL